MVTGLVDYLSIQDNAYLLREMERLDKVPAPLATTRILSNPTTQGPRPDVAPTVASEVRTNPSSPLPPLTHCQTHCPAGVLTILRQFGLEDLAHSLEQTGGLDQVWNVLSLESNMHIYFNHFDVWFEGTGKVRPTDPPSRTLADRIRSPTATGSVFPMHSLGGLSTSSPNVLKRPLLTPRW